MKFTIDENILKKYNLSMEEFVVILYYLCEKHDILNYDLCEKLWNKNYLIKTLIGYDINNNKLSEIYSWFQESEALLQLKNSPRDLNQLAIQLMELFPKGSKDKKYPWRGNIKDIVSKLRIFLKNYDNKWTDKEIINATKNYINSFNGDITYMKILKYFILKDNESELANWLENDADEDDVDENWTDNFI